MRMDDAHRVPGRLDGMACFDGEPGTLVLLRNSEQTADDVDTSPFADGSNPPEQAFDPTSLGGVTRTILRADTLERVGSNLVLAGTERNCAGGPSPWGWLSCEESVAIPGEDAVTRRHGYVFLCPPGAKRAIEAQPIVGYGRFRHEAVAIDPRTHVAYLTEDREDGCLYRFVPDRPDQPFRGRLQALVVRDAPRFDTSNAGLVSMPEGSTLPCTWVDLEDADPAGDSLRHEAMGKGAARFERGEGAWMADDILYFSCTAGGRARLGQLFRYRPHQDARGDGALELLVESSDAATLDHPDNITVAPWGDIFVSEDDYAPWSRDLLRVITPHGQVFDFARDASNSGELTGVCFSPDGHTLFVNMYAAGITLAVTGPFVRGLPV